jgi:hypothetical protein
MTVEPWNVSLSPFFFWVVVPIIFKVLVSILIYILAVICGWSVFPKPKPSPPEQPKASPPEHSHVYNDVTRNSLKIVEDSFDEMLLLESIWTYSSDQQRDF